jgi:hypothetical protein
MLVMERDGWMVATGRHTGHPFVTITGCGGWAGIIGDPIGKAAPEVTAIPGILRGEQSREKDYCRNFFQVVLVAPPVAAPHTLTSCCLQWLHYPKKMQKLPIALFELKSQNSKCRHQRAGR